jgi:hypothetical protein
MFGIKNKITDRLLYMLDDMLENHIINAKHELLELPPEKQDRIDFLKAQIENYETERERFRIDIQQQLSEKFQFSIEELYAMYGQYDNKFVSIEFHKFSESALKFGRNIEGVFVYYKSEREKLEELINADIVPRTNGMVKIDCSNQNNLSDDIKTDLLNNGFKSGDIHEILSVNLPVVKSYNKSGKKEIPNTINIPFDPTNFDPNKMNLWLFSQRINDGGILIEEEMDKFCGLSIYLKPDSEHYDLVHKYTFNDKGQKKPGVRFYELEAKLYYTDISPEELFEFNELLKKRSIKRTELIRKEIMRSTNKTIEQFEIEYPDIYSEIQKSIYRFDAESLEYYDMTIPIYWDYESYLHIYLRHCEELNIEGHFENKTKFQYKQKDIRRILKIAIEKLKHRINERLENGKEFRIYGDRTLYFNGNHYSLHILSNGRVAAFHPMENPN